MISNVPSSSLRPKIGDTYPWLSRESARCCRSASSYVFGFPPWKPRSFDTDTFASPRILSLTIADVTTNKQNPARGVRAGYQRGRRRIGSIAFSETVTIGASHLVHVGGASTASAASIFRRAPQSGHRITALPTLGDERIRARRRDIAA